MLKQMPRLAVAALMTFFTVAAYAANTPKIRINRPGTVTYQDAQNVKQTLKSGQRLLAGTTLTVQGGAVTIRIGNTVIKANPGDSFSVDQSGKITVVAGNPQVSKVEASAQVEGATVLRLLPPNNLQDLTECQKQNPVSPSAPPVKC